MGRSPTGTIQKRVFLEGEDTRFILRCFWPLLLVPSDKRNLSEPVVCLAQSPFELMPELPVFLFQFSDATLFGEIPPFLTVSMRISQVSVYISLTSLSPIVLWEAEHSAHRWVTIFKLCYRPWWKFPAHPAVNLQPSSAGKRFWSHALRQLSH